MKPTFLLLAAAALLAAADQRPADEKAVLAAVDQFNQAAHSGDRATLEKLLSPDLVYGHSSAKMETKAECVEALVKGKHNFVPRPGSTAHLYGKTAIVRSKTDAHLVQNGKPTEIALDVLQVWVKEGKTWVMVARHTTRIP